MHRSRLVLLLALLAVALVFVARRGALEKLESSAFHPRKLGARTPATVGLAFEDVRFQSGGRELRGFYVAPPEGPRRAAVLIFHGDNESISSWVPVQTRLFDAGVGSMVFDYTGYGASPGKPTFARLHEDGLAAWSAFRARLPPGTRACGYGLSLGSGVLLEDAPSLTPPPDCLVVYGAFTSILEAGVRLHRLPRWLSLLLPDALVSLDNVARAPAPLLVEHGDADEKFPVEDARALAARAPHATLVVVPGHNHAQPVVAPDAAAWDPVVKFVRGE